MHPNSSWSLEPADVPVGYVCPICALNGRSGDRDALEAEFAVWKAIYPEPICEGCFRMLPYLLATPPGELLHPPRTVLVKLASLLRLPDERILMVRYMDQEIRELSGSPGFKAFYAGQRVSRRIAKKRWKILLAALERSRAVVLQQMPSELRRLG
jgi:hypothetical protein